MNSSAANASTRNTWFIAVLALVLIWTLFKGTHHQLNAVPNASPNVAPDVAPNTAQDTSATSGVVSGGGKIINAETLQDTVPEDNIFNGDTSQSSGGRPPKTITGTKQDGQPIDSYSPSVDAPYPSANDHYAAVNDHLPAIPNPSPSPSPSPVPSTSSDTYRSKEDKPLITYVYTESEFGRENLQFFINHGLHDAADFIFILNGDTNVSSTVIPEKENIKIVQRDNTCFDLGSHAEVLMSEQPGGGKALKDMYKYFILMNASIRGPFIPTWSKACWTDAYLGKLTDKVKLVGSTLNCQSNHDLSHVQSMIWATDTLGLSHILPSISTCFTKITDAMQAEIHTTPNLRKLGYEIDVMMTSYSSEKNHSYIDKHCDSYDDMLYPNRYFGANVHPFELIFIKTQRAIDDTLRDRMTEWVDGSGYSSYDFCRLGS